MGIERTWTIGTGAATVAAVMAIGAGVALGQGGEDAQAEPPAATLDHTCVLGPDAPSPSEAAAQPWLAGLMARSDALDRQYGLGRYAPGGDCRDTPDWFRALILRSDALNQAGNLGRYAPTR